MNLNLQGLTLEDRLGSGGTTTFQAEGADGGDADAEAQDEDEEDTDVKGEGDKEEADAEAQDEDEDESMEAGAQATAIVRMCNDAGVPKLAELLLAEGASVKAAKARIVDAGNIRKFADTIRSRFPVVNAKLVDELVAKGVSIEAAKATFLDLIVSSQSAEIRNTQGDNPGAGAGSYDHGWDKVIAKANGDES